MKFIGIYEETLRREVEIEADDEQQAADILDEMIDSEEIVLDYSDSYDTNTMIKEAPEN